MKKIVFLTIMVLSILCLPSFGAPSSEDEYVNILLLNSYHDGYAWSNDTKQGILDVLDEQLDAYQLRVEHMDTKHAHSDEYMAQLLALYQTKFQADEFDMIISADDNALTFLLKYRDVIFDDTPVIFCGVNTLATHDFSDAEKFYGVVEKHSIAETTEVILKLNPNLKHVYLVVDDSITGRATKQDARADMAYLEDRVTLHIFDDMSFDEIMQTVSMLDPADSVVLQSFYVVDKDGTTYTLEETAERLIQDSSVPVFGIFSFAFGQGSVGGKFVEGYTQGQRAANMLIEYLNTQHIKGDKYVVDESFNRYHFDYKMIQAYGYDPKVLPKNSIIINQPVSFFEEHARVLAVSIGIFFLLMAYVCLLKREICLQSSRMVTTQTQLIESEKMASLGRMVAGVAHEVNTPIGIGVSLASFLRLETDKMLDKLLHHQMTGEDLKKYMGQVGESSDAMLSTMERASELVSNFKQVAVDQMVDEKRAINLQTYIEDIVSSLKSELKHKEIKIDIHSQEKIITKCHTGAIYQIMLNLIMNSLKHGFEDLDYGHITIQLTLHDDEVQVKYRDDGIGIPQKALNDIFDPFYTTKRGDGGSGLGLNIVHDLVTERLSGSISCHSVYGEYTEFVIVFPIEG